MEFQIQDAILPQLLNLLREPFTELLHIALMIFISRLSLNISQQSLFATEK